TILEIILKRYLGWTRRRSLPGAARLPECAPRHGQEPDSRSGTRSPVRRAFHDFATGRFTKDEVRKNVIALGLKTRRGKPVPLADLRRHNKDLHDAKETLSTASGDNRTALIFDMDPR